MNLPKHLANGQKGMNKGIPLGREFDGMSSHIGGLRRKKIIGIAAGAKVGKTTFTDHCFILSTYFEALKAGTLKDIEWTYISLEEDRITKEVSFVCHILYHLYGVEEMVLNAGNVYEGGYVIPMTPDLLQGIILDDNKKVITLNNEIKGFISEIYKKHIIPLSGKYDTKGNLLKRGKITWYTEALTLEETEAVYQDIIDCDPKHMTNRKSLKVIITDTIRKTKKGNRQLKETIDDVIALQEHYRNTYEYTFIDIIHMNRGDKSITNIKHLGETYYPREDHIKDTGNLVEACDLLFTMMDPYDNTYKLKKHFGLVLRVNNDTVSKKNYPNLVTIHLIRARGVKAPKHFRYNMLSNYRYLKKFKR